MLADKKSAPLPLALLQGLRPRQWTKNALVFAGLLFTLDQPHPLTDYLRVGGAFVAFCLLSGCTYLWNDIIDVGADRQHPKKRNRPIASGALPIGLAKVFAFVIAPVTLGVSAWLLGPSFALVAGLYLFQTLAYSLYLKNVVLVDVMAVAGGFVLRAVAGSVAIAVNPSEWLLLCTLLLALFLALCKRRGELVALGAAPPTRAILSEYTVPMLDQLINIVASTCLIAYTLYTFFSKTGQHSPYLMATVPFVLYGLFRYLYLSQKKGLGEAPETVLLEDRPLQINLLLWTLAAIIAMRLR